MCFGGGKCEFGVVESENGGGGGGGGILPAEGFWVLQKVRKRTPPGGTPPVVSEFALSENSCNSLQRTRVRACMQLVACKSASHFFLHTRCTSYVSSHTYNECKCSYKKFLLKVFLTKTSYFDKKKVEKRGGINLISRYGVPPQCITSHERD